MATKVLTTLQDDIDGSAATETVRFGLDGVEWEIDLSERNANRLRNSLSDLHGTWPQSRWQAHAQADVIQSRRHQGGAEVG